MCSWYPVEERCPICCVSPGLCAGCASGELQLQLPERGTSGQVLRLHQQLRSKQFLHQVSIMTRKHLLALFVGLLVNLKKLPPPLTLFPSLSLSVSLFLSLFLCLSLSLSVSLSTPPPQSRHRLQVLPRLGGVPVGLLQQWGPAVRLSRSRGRERRLRDVRRPVPLPAIRHRPRLLHVRHGLLGVPQLQA